MKSFFLGSFVIFLLACSPEQKRMDYKLSDEDFAKLLLDIHYADVILADLTVGQRDSLRAIYWSKMTDIYHLTESELQEEVRKLEGDPKKMKLILDKVKMMADSIR